MLEQQYTPAEVAKASRRHVVTVRADLEAGVLHGTQRAKHAHWRIAESCAAAYIRGEKCEHQAKRTNVTQLRRSA